MSADIFSDIEDPVGDFQDHVTSSNNLDGQLSDGMTDRQRSIPRDLCELDEPILDTLKRDLVGIYQKTKIIALPLSSYDIYKVVLRGWDLWGPLMLCTFIAFELHHTDHKTKGNYNIGPQFADVFVLVWFGSCIVSLNYRLLTASSDNLRLITRSTTQEPSRDRSFIVDDQESSPETKPKNAISSDDVTPHQTLLAPPSIFQLMCVFGYCLVGPCFGLIILRIFSFRRLMFERVLVGLLFGFIWPTYCSIRILVRYQHPSKRALAIYPIGLFYFVLSCMIILNH